MPALIHLNHQELRSKKQVMFLRVLISTRGAGFFKPNKNSWPVQILLSTKFYNFTSVSEYGLAGTRPLSKNFGNSSQQQPEK